MDPGCPQPNLEDQGALNFLKVRAPISPSLALLMTGVPHLRTVRRSSSGTSIFAANINAFTIANADRQWMSMPGTEVPIAAGYLDPISIELVPGYGRAEVEASAVRQQVTELVQAKQGQDIHDAVDENGRTHAEIVSAS